ncbi:MAG: hypothetical protein ABJG68_09075 [Crocinitomicaceae bacterium]
MRKLIAFVALITGTLSFTACETDFSLNGDYEIQPIVFGLIDHTDDVHLIKITKAFLGDGDNLVYAQNPDSNYFNQVDGKVIEFLDGEATGREWVLTDTIIATKDADGLFYGPEQKIYKFYADDLDSSATYNLELEIENGAHQVTGTTELISRFKTSKSGLEISPVFKLTFAPSTVSEDDDYSKWVFGITEGKNAAAYTFFYSMRYQEEYADASTQNFEITHNFYETEQDKPQTPSSQQVNVDGLDFYTWVEGEILPDPNVVRRRFIGIDFKIGVAHYEFQQYMDVSQPVTGIAQVQPEFTNLTGARGLFSSRIIMDINNFLLDGNSMEQLCVGLHTGGLAFKSDYPEHMGENFYAP